MRANMLISFCLEFLLHLQRKSHGWVAIINKFALVCLVVLDLFNDRYDDWQLETGGHIHHIPTQKRKKSIFDHFQHTL